MNSKEPASKKFKVSFQDSEESSEKATEEPKERRPFDEKLKEGFQKEFHNYSSRGVEMKVKNYNSKKMFEERMESGEVKYFHTFQLHFEFIALPFFQNVEGDVRITFKEKKGKKFVTNCDGNTISLCYTMNEKWKGWSGRIGDENEEEEAGSLLTSWDAKKFIKPLKEFVHNSLIEYVCHILFKKDRDLYDDAKHVLSKTINVDVFSQVDFNARKFAQEWMNL